MPSNNNNNLDNDKDNNSNTKETADTSTIYFADSSMQTKAKFDQNKKADDTKDNKFVASAGKDIKSDDASAAGTDEAKTAEQKTFGDTELSKGLEAQAKDEEL